MRYLSLIMVAICLFLNGCYVYKELETGTYTDKDSNKIKLVLNKDASFCYQEYMYGKMGFSSGIWKFTNKLILNSTNEKIEDSLQVIEKNNETDGSINFIITDFNNAPFSYGCIIINNSIKYLDENGKITLFNFNNSLKDFSLKYLSFSSPTYYVKQTKSNTFIIKTNLMNITNSGKQIVFTNKKIKVLKNKLVVRNSNGKKHNLYDSTHLSNYKFNGRLRD